MNEIRMLLILYLLGLAIVVALLYWKRKALGIKNIVEVITSVIVVSLICLFIIVHIMETCAFIKQFPPSFAEDLYRDFGHLEKQYEKVPPCIKGKAIVIEIRTEREFKPKISGIINLDLLRRGFPIAQSASEVNTIIFLRYYNVHVGQYIGRGRISGSAYRIDVDITIVDKAKGAVVGTKTIYGSDPPGTTTGSGDRYGEKPSNEEIIKYLESLYCFPKF